MRIFFCFFLVVLLSCKSDKQYQLIAVENIQYLFERFVDDQSDFEKIDQISFSKNSWLSKKSVKSVQDSLNQHLISKKRLFKFSLQKDVLFAEFRGNVLIIKDLPNSLQFVKLYEKQILADNNLKFYWDTLSSPLKLFVVDINNGVKFIPKTENKECEAKCVINLKLLEADKNRIGAYKAKQIGKEFIVVQSQNFVAGSAKIEQSGNNILLRGVL